MTKSKSETKQEAVSRMHTVILKEKDKEGNMMYMSVDSVMPTFIFGENFPMIMAVVDDRAFFIPMEQVNWFEQNRGVKNDHKIARAMMDEKRKNDQMNEAPEDAAFN
jgi:hypothetical protein